MNEQVLIEQYPFAEALSPMGERLGFTWLTFLPEVWVENFGEKMLEEMANAIKQDRLGKVQVLDAKEKYGTLRIYTDVSGDNLDRVIMKYEKESRKYPIGKEQSK